MSSKAADQLLESHYSRLFDTSFVLQHCESDYVSPKWHRSKKATHATEVDDNQMLIAESRSVDDQTGPDAYQEILQRRFFVLRKMQKLSLEKKRKESQMLSRKHGDVLIKKPTSRGSFIHEAWFRMTGSLLRSLAKTDSVLRDEVLDTVLEMIGKVSIDGLTGGPERVVDVGVRVQTDFLLDVCRLDDEKSVLKAAMTLLSLASVTASADLLLHSVRSFIQCHARQWRLHTATVGAHSSARSLLRRLRVRIREPNLDLPRREENFIESFGLSARDDSPSVHDSSLSDDKLPSPVVDVCAWRGYLFVLSIHAHSEKRGSLQATLLKVGSGTKTSHTTRGKIY
eukprot:720586_1